MAFTRTPQNSTYKTEIIKFDATSTLRSGDDAVRRDSHIINFYYDRVSQENKEREVALKKRPGVFTTEVSLSKISASDPIRGYFYEEQEDIYFWVVGNKVYKYIPSGPSYTPLICTLATTSGDVCFKTFQKSTGEVYILISDGTNLWSQQLRTYPDTAGAAVVDLDMPTDFNPYFVVLDGFVFLSKGNTIYNSDVDTFDAWTAGNDIDAEMSADSIRILFQNKNYIVAIGYNSLEIFWDAANETGTPLKRQDSGFKSIGYISAYNNVGDEHFFVGQDKSNNISVYRMENFKVDKISNSVVERSIQNLQLGFSSQSRAVGAKGVILSVDGHTFYALTTTENTWVYDIEEKMWYEWRSPTGIFSPEASWAKYNGAQYIANSGTATIDCLSPVFYNDKGVLFTCSYTTEDSLFGSTNWKTANRLSLVCDRHLATANSTVVVQWSDNDWTDNPTNSQNVNIFSNMPIARRLGRFRNRSFRLLYTDNYPLRMKYLELEINIGAH